MKIKEIEAYILALLHAFLTGMQRNLQDRGYVGWGRGSLSFQHISMIQEITATT